jgi:cytoskeleton protein RodZ
MSASNTTEESDIEPKSDIEHRGAGPGDLLQAGRVKMEMSIEDVATLMHLSRDIVKAIEANNFSDITAPIFVKGYLRAYARIVSLDEEEMINRYAEFYSYEDPPISAISNVAAQISVSDRRVKVITYLVITSLVVLLTIWWWSRYQTPADVVSLDAQQSNEIRQFEIEAASESTIDTQAPEVSSGLSTDVEESVADTGEEAGTSTQFESLPETVPEADFVAMAEPIEEPTEVPETTSGLQPEPEDVTVTDPLQESDVAAAVVLTDPITGVSPIGSDQLKIVVNADSWIEISDASGHRLLYRLVRANQKFNLTGKAPFTVFIGNGYGVEVTFNGEEVDVISRVRGDNTVKLKIGG